MIFLADAFWSRVRQPVEQAFGLPPKVYCDESFFALERQRLFERSWVVVGVADEVNETGRMLVRQVGDKSILIVRGTDGKLRGFLNACRHRGTELAEADCHVASLIRCPYHRWGYRLDGSLAATPRFNEVPRPDFDRLDYALVPIRVEIWGALLFACLEPETMPLTQWLGDLPARMGGYGFESWQLREESSIDVKVNWKLITENFQEYYHLKWVHPALAKVSRMEDHYRYQGPGMYCGQTTTPISEDERDDWTRLPPAADLDKSDSVSGRFVAIFPNAMIAVVPSHAFLILLEPVSAELTRERCIFLFPSSLQAVTDDEFATTRKFWFEINDEDISIMRRAQRGLTRTLMPPGPLSPRFEEPLNRFHKMVADTVTAETLAASHLEVPDGDGPDTGRRYGVATNPVPASVDHAAYAVGASSAPGPS